MFKTIRLLEEVLQKKVDSFKSEEGRKNAEKLILYIKSIEKSSAKIMAWSLTIVGGTFLAILSDEYVHPEERKLKFPYILFILGWSAFAKSISDGISISRSAIASELHVDDMNLLSQIWKNCNKSYASQLKYFKTALVFLGVWLFLYLIWWIFGNIPTKTIKLQ